MTGPGLPVPGSAAAENELLAQLGLPKSASPEDLDDLHQAVSQYLASAPPELRGWARAQAAALDEAYLQLTDPVGFGGSALRSPARPPAVVPGGPATPPARRGSVPAADPILAAASAGALSEAMTDAGADAGIESVPGEPDVDDLALLYASVTPSAHPDMLPDAKPKTAPPKAAAPRAATPPVAAPIRHRKTARHAAAAAPVAAPPAANPWKRLVLAGVAVVAIVGVGFGGMQVVGAIGGGSPTPAAVAQAPQASQGPPAVDAAKVGALMEKLAADPKDTVTLLALADEYYAGQQFEQAGDFLDKLLAIEPENVQALLARGAVSFNLARLDEAETTWTKVVEIDPKNVEAHYDLGFLYLNSATPDWAGVQREWNMVIELDPTSNLAKTVQSHLDSLVMNSMIPASPGGSPAAPSASPAGTPAASPAASANPAPSASPAASTVP